MEEADVMSNDVELLKQAVDEYLQWMILEGYSDRSVLRYDKFLADFVDFVEQREINWHAIFTLETFQDFQNEKGEKKSNGLHAIRGLSRYLHQQNRIAYSFPSKKINQLPQIYEEYFSCCTNTRQDSASQVGQAKRVLAALNVYLEETDTKISSLTIQQIDTFDAEFNSAYAQKTREIYLTHIRGFLRYLYQERKILKTNLAPLVVGPHVFSLAKPPTFLRPHELQRLFAVLELSTSWNLRVNAIIYLAYTLGLRPKEICQITLDDIAFKKRELRIKARKGNNPTTLPIPQTTIKAIAAYLVGGRHASKRRELFLNVNSPYRPVTYSILYRDVKICMRKAGLPPEASPYWLRHTYAQNLLETGTSIYEIKEMMGHECIESTQRYLHIHLPLMREVLFNEKI
jgi:integrase/recombinase XerD